VYLGRGEWKYFVQGTSLNISTTTDSPLTYSFLQLPGHKGTVTAVDFHPKEPISAFTTSLLFSLLNFLPLVLTGSKDGTMLLGEIEAGIKI
jgi:hypothetical protein